MNYFEYFKRLVTFKKYPLFRTVPFRYLLLNILVLSILIAAPNIVSLVVSVNATSHLTDESTELPDFTIDNSIYYGETEVVNIGEQNILFTEELSIDDNDEIDEDILLGFLKDGIYIQNVQNNGFSYSLIGDVSNDEELQEFIDNQLSSLYFYIVMYGLIYVILIYTITFTVLLLGSLIVSFFSKLMHKKSDYMNWFKIASYITVLFYVPVFVISLFVCMPLWFLYIFTLPFYMYYYKKLPALKKK
jgi:hypothetical protein